MKMMGSRVGVIRDCMEAQRKELSYQQAIVITRRKKSDSTVGLFSCFCIHICIRMKTNMSILKTFIC